MEAGKLRILLVDPDDQHRAVVRKRLEPLGLAVSDAVNGAQALKVIQQNGADLVLLDTNLPDMDGVALLQDIRMDFSPAQLAVIMVTGSALISDIVRSHRSGANDYVTKPVDFPTLIGRMKMQLSGKRRPALARAS